MTSGLGTCYGGIGVVSEMVARALEMEGEVTCWRHHCGWPGPMRRAALFARAILGAMRKPSLVVYEHVDLAVLHRVVPRLSEVPYIVFLHGTEVWKPLDQPRRAALLGARLLLGVSNTTVTEARKANPWLPRVEVTWLGSPRPLMDVKVPLSRREPVALMLGRLHPGERYKGHDQVLDAWGTVRRAVPDARLVIVGGGRDLARLRTRVEREGLVGVEFRGHVSDRERDALLGSARVLLAPSLREGFGLAAVEAAAVGTPVLGLTGTVIAELFPGKDEVVLSRTQSPVDLGPAISSALLDPAQAEIISKAAMKRVAATYLEAHFVARFRAALHSIGG